MAQTSVSDLTVGILVTCLVVLTVLLVYLYKKLNKEAEGQYTIRRMVYKEGGVRDQVRSVALAVGARLGIRLWRSRDSDKSGEELQEIHDGERDLERGGSERSNSEQEEEEGNEEECSSTASKDSGTSDDESGSEAGESARLTGQPEGAGATENAVAKESDEEVKGDASGSAELSIDLKQFSGSAIWSEEQMDEANDVTQL